MAQRIAEDSLTVRDAEDLVRSEKVEKLKSNPVIARQESRTKFVNSAEMADIENFNIVDYPKYEDEFEQILLDAFSFAQLKIFDNPIEKFKTEFFELSKVEGIQARIPFLINIE